MTRALPAVLSLLALGYAGADSPFYTVPQPVIQALQPRGLRISIPDEAGIELFAVHANVNKELRDLEAGQISYDVTKSKDGRWTYEDTRTRLNPGDVINYWLYVQVDGLGHRKDAQTFTVKELVPPDTPIVTPPRPGAMPQPPWLPMPLPEQVGEDEVKQLRVQLAQQELENSRRLHETRVEHEKELQALRVQHAKELQQERLRLLQEDCGGADPPGQRVWRHRRSTPRANSPCKP